jgi:hypothetical protein
MMANCRRSARFSTARSEISLNGEYAVQNSFRSFFITGEILDSLSENINEFKVDGFFARDNSHL